MVRNQGNSRSPCHRGFPRFTGPLVKIRSFTKHVTRARGACMSWDHRRHLGDPCTPNKIIVRLLLALTTCSVRLGNSSDWNGTSALSPASCMACHDHSLEANILLTTYPVTVNDLMRSDIRPRVCYKSKNGTRTNAASIYQRTAKPRPPNRTFTR
jgi:hypothetical protein